MRFDRRERHPSVAEGEVCVFVFWWVAQSDFLETSAIASRLALRSQEPFDLLFQHRNEFGLHKFVPIWNIEAHDLFTPYVGRKTLRKFGLVRAFHDKDHLRPRYLLC